MIKRAKQINYKEMEAREKKSDEYWLKKREIICDKKMKR